MIYEAIMGTIITCSVYCVCSICPVCSAFLDYFFSIYREVATAAGEHETGRAHANGMRQKAASRVPAAIKRSTQSSWRDRVGKQRQQWLLSRLC